MSLMDSYTTNLAGGAHWSFVARKGVRMTVTDLEGGANVGLLFYNHGLLHEKYNAPDTLKCQHTFKLTKGNCLYSDMGRIFCSIVDDDFGWHDTVCGNSHAEHVAQRWGARSYQRDRNAWKQNGYDSFLVELAKYGLGRNAIAANLNLFSEVTADADGNLHLSRQAQAGNRVVLRFEMDTLVLLHTCPHPLNVAMEYPARPVGIELVKGPPPGDDDLCRNHCDENRRGFANNALYFLGQD
jgi:urea carboxylase-associated protein 2